MSPLAVMLEIARWEFLRWFRWKDQIVTLAFSLAAGLAVWGGMAYLQRTEAGPVRLAVLGDPAHVAPFTSSGRFDLRPAGNRSEEDLLADLTTGHLDGILRLRGPDEAELSALKEPRWRAELVRTLTAQRRPQTAPPFAVTLSVQGGGRPAGTAEKVAAGVLVALMLIGVFFSAGSQFLAITGEKQLRVTEQILAAVTPQQWIDGKILGVSAFSLVRLVTLMLGGVLFLGTGAPFGGGAEVPAMLIQPGLILLLALLNFLGFLFWNASFAAIAATINDPNTSSKSGYLFLPFLFSMGMAVGVGFKNPDSLLSRILTLLPPTGPAALSTRLVLTEVPAWEILCSLLLLGGALWLMRVAAARVFRLGMLMYGKEPTPRELWTWMTTGFEHHSPDGRPHRGTGTHA